MLVYPATHTCIIIEYLLGSLVVDSRKNAYSSEEGTAERTAEKKKLKIKNPIKKMNL